MLLTLLAGDLVVVGALVAAVVAAALLVRSRIGAGRRAAGLALGLPWRDAHTVASCAPGLHVRDPDADGRWRARAPGRGPAVSSV